MSGRAVVWCVHDAAPVRHASDRIGSHIAALLLVRGTAHAVEVFAEQMLQCSK
jgi:hypothetical protein